MRRKLFLLCCLVLLPWTAHAQPRDPGALPAGHPPVSSSDLAEGGPRDVVEETASLAPGTVVVTVVSGQGVPVASEQVTLGILSQSVARGETRGQRVAVTDSEGRVEFRHLDPSSAISYRASVARDGARFLAPPFALSPRSGTRVVLHVYPVVHDLQGAPIALEAMVFLELKDDRIQVEQSFRIFNGGQVAWAPDGLVIKLPEGFVALTAEQGMTDQGVDPTPLGARLRGTFGPGQHSVEYRWQLPWSGDAEQVVDLPLPPRVVAAQVIALAATDMELAVDGFAAATPERGQGGQALLVAHRELRPEETPIPRLRVALRGLPTVGPGRLLAAIASAFALLIGLGFAVGAPKARDFGAIRARVLEDLEALEEAHRCGDVGPKTYLRERQALVDALARTF